MSWDTGQCHVLTRVSAPDGGFPVGLAFESNQVLTLLGPLCPTGQISGIETTNGPVGAVPVLFLVYTLLASGTTGRPGL